MIPTPPSAIPAAKLALRIRKHLLPHSLFIVMIPF
jgi:hypothetical protein